MGRYSRCRRRRRRREAGGAARRRGRPRVDYALGRKASCGGDGDFGFGFGDGDYRGGGGPSAVEHCTRGPMAEAATFCHARSCPSDPSAGGP